MPTPSRSNIILALKEGNKQAAQKALLDFIRNIPKNTTVQEVLRMTEQQYRLFANAIRRGDLDMARKIFKVGENEKEIDIDWSALDTMLSKIFPTD